MYLKIAFLAIARLLLYIRRRYPPPTRSQQHAQPTLKIFYFFYFFSKGVNLMFPLLLCILRICVGRWKRSRRTDGNHQTWGLTISRHSVVALRDVVISLL